MKRLHIVLALIVISTTSCDRRYLNIDFFVPTLDSVRREYPELLISTNGFTGISGDYDINYEMFSYRADQNIDNILDYYVGITNWALVERTTNVIVLANISPNSRGITQAWIGSAINRRIVIALLSRSIPKGTKRLEDTKWKPLADRIKSEFLAEMNKEMVQQSAAPLPRAP